MKKTNFDLHLEEELKESGFAKRFHRAGQAWDVFVAARQNSAGAVKTNLGKVMKSLPEIKEAALH